MQQENGGFNTTYHQELRDKIALVIYEQMIKDNGLMNITKISPEDLKRISEGVSKTAYEFADTFMHRRYESMCIKATNINFDDLIKK